MAIKVNYTTKKDVLPDILSSFLPYRLVDEIEKISGTGRIEEIRIRRGRAASLTYAGKNLLLGTVLSADEMDRLFSDICGRSIYAHSETIRRGYVLLEGGIRVGVCGRAVIEGESVTGVYEPSAINIRLPMAKLDVGEPVCQILHGLGGLSGVLVYSPPAEGKTTLLRSVAMNLASGKNPLRVALVDTRGELSYALENEGACLDVLFGYPRGVGIEIATRTMSAELIVCDEIGDEVEAEAIIAAQNAGVPLLASAHGEDVEGLLRRSGIARLHRARVFGAYVGIKRHRGDFSYTVTPWEEADAIFKAFG